MLSEKQIKLRTSDILSLTKENGSTSYRYFNENVKEITSESDKLFSERLERIKQFHKELEQNKQNMLEAKKHTSNLLHSMSPTLGHIYDASRDL